VTDEISISSSWKPQVARVANRFNKYAKRHSMSVVTNSIEQLMQMLSYSTDNDVRHDAAKAMREIINKNPKIVSSAQKNKVKEMLVTLQSGQSHIATQSSTHRHKKKKQLETDEYEDWRTQQISKKKSKLSPISGDSSSIGFAHSNRPSKGKKAMTAADLLQGSSNPFLKTTKKFDGGSEWNSVTTYSKNDSPSTGSVTIQPLNEEYQPPQDQQFEVWTEESIQEGQGSNPEADIDLMSLPMSKIPFINIKKVDNPAEYVNRKCAMGDGDFENYSGTIYICECGVVYHETCLKMQANYGKICHICDRPLLKQ